MEDVAREILRISMEIQRLRGRRQKLLRGLPVGRVVLPGAEKDLYVIGEGWATRFSAVRLKELVPVATLNLCRISYERGRSVRTVPKLKRPAK
jgi:hypothetical protein